MEHEAQRIPRARAQFLRADGSRVLQLGEDRLIVNALPPHVGWDELCAEVRRVLAEYREVARPEELLAASVQYVNRVVLPPDSASALDVYFTSLPSVPPGMTGSLRSFQVAAEATYVDPAGVLRFAFRTGEIHDGQPTFMLEYQHAWVEPQPLGFDEVVDWLNVGHDRIELAFYGSFTAECHTRLFQEDTG